MQRAIRTCIMRGGSSKGLYLRSQDLPAPGKLRNQVILRLYGSPDPRQIDGLGGADVLTSKVAIIGPPTRAGADVDYTFGQVSFVTDHVDYGGNCGNISAGVAPFAIDEHLFDWRSAADRAGRCTVRIHNTNTGAILKASVLTGEHGAMVEGDTRIAGVPGTGSCVELDFSETQGSVTGKLLPTGRRVEVLEVAGTAGSPAEGIEATLLDAGQPTVFIRSADLGLAAEVCESPALLARLLQSERLLMERIERIRGVGASRMGIVEHAEDAEVKSPYTPFVVLVGSRGKGSKGDLTATCVFMQQVHQAYPVTGSVATTAAALLPGTIVHDACSKTHGGPLRIAHPGGVMEVGGEVRDGSEPELLRASITRTARRLMDGTAYVPWPVWSAEG